MFPFLDTLTLVDVPHGLGFCGRVFMIGVMLIRDNKLNLPAKMGIMEGFLNLM